MLSIGRFGVWGLGFDVWGLGLTVPLDAVYAVDGQRPKCESQTPVLELNNFGKKHVCILQP